MSEPEKIDLPPNVGVTTPSSPSDDWRADLDGPSLRRGRAWRMPLLIVLGIAIYWLSLRPAESRVKWLSDFGAAAAAAKAQGVPLLVDFWADWCGPCQSLDAKVFSSQAVEAAVVGHFVPVRVNVSSHSRDTPEAELAFRYADPVTGKLTLPSLFVIDPRDGAVLAKAAPEDLERADAMIAFLKRHQGLGEHKGGPQ